MVMDGYDTPTLEIYLNLIIFSFMILNGVHQKSNETSLLSPFSEMSRELSFLQTYPSITKQSLVFFIGF